MSKEKIKSFNFDGFDGGINWNGFLGQIKDNELSDCLNMYYNSGSLLSRPGAKVINEVETSDFDEGFDVNPLGDVYYVSDGAVKLFSVSRNDETGFYNNILLVKEDGSCNYFNLAEFYPEDYENGIEKINCLAFSGKETEGCGIYFLVCLIDNSGEVCDKYIFELGADLETLYSISASQIYAPLVYINGRGTRYSEVSASEKSLATPKAFEDFNILSSGFRAAYTTDGLSSSFFLPVKNISDNIGEKIEITYTDNNGDVYKWIIPYYSTVSGAVSVGDQGYVSFKINRAQGKIITLNSNSEEVALAFSNTHLNNLVIKAYKSQNNNAVFLSTVSQSFNSRVFISGYSEEGNVIRYSKQNNPLYFPVSNVSFFGDKSSNILAIKQNNDRLIVFKAHQIGACSSVKYSNYNVDPVLNGNLTNASASSVKEKMEVKTINSTVGCIYPDTILNCANRLIFYGSDRRVYVMTTTSNYLQRFYRISDKIDSRLCKISVSYNAFAFDWDGRYSLFIDNKCFLFDYNTNAFLSSTNAGRVKKDLAWFYFEFNLGLAKPIFAFSVDKKHIIVTRLNLYGAARKIVLYSYGGEEDQKAVSLTEFQNTEVRSKFSTASSLLSDEHLKRIIGIDFVFTQEALTYDTPLSLDYIKEDSSEYIGAIYVPKVYTPEITVKKTPCISSVRRFGIALDKDNTFGIKRIRLYYKPMK